MNTLTVSQIELVNMIKCFNAGDMCNTPLSLGNVPYMRIKKLPAQGKFWVLVAVKQVDYMVKGNKNYFMLQQTFTGYLLVTFLGQDFTYDSINTIEFVRMAFIA